MIDSIKTFESRKLDTGRLMLTPEDCSASCPTERLISALKQIGFIGEPRPCPTSSVPAGWNTNGNAIGHGTVHDSAQDTLHEALHDTAPAAIHNTLPATETGTASGTILAFEPGERFSQHLAFTGCAVQIGGESDIHVVLPAVSAQPVLLVGRNSRPPRCPGCGSTLKEWRAQLTETLQPGTAPNAVPDTALVASKNPSLVCARCEIQALASDWDWRKQADVGRQWLVVEGVFPNEASPLPSLLAALEGLGLGPWRHSYLQR